LSSKQPRLNKTSPLLRKALHRFWQIIAKALQQGMTPRMLAITIALGAVISVFPVYGLTTLLCFLLAVAFRLNIVVIQAVNYLLTPLQLLLLIPFMQGGIWLLGLRPVNLDLDELMIRFKRDFVELLQELGLVMLGGIAFWVLLALPIFFLIFITAHLLLNRFMRHTD
jgi:uncharacterized protein (DUF2062 family)